MEFIPLLGSTQGKKQARQWLLLSLLASLCALLLAAFPILTARRDHRILLAEDALNPLADLITPLAGESLVRYEPYLFGQKIPGHGQRTGRTTR